MISDELLAALPSIPKDYFWYECPLDDVNESDFFYVLVDADTSTYHAFQLMEMLVSEG